MVSNETLNLLAKLVGGINTQPQPDMARQILLRSQIDWKVPNQKIGGGSSGGPSVVSRIFDLLSRPNYQVAAESQKLLRLVEHPSVHNLIDYGANLVDFRALAGKDKTTFQNVLNSPEAGPLQRQPQWAKAIEGLGLDIGLDPTTYVGPGAIKGIFKGGKLAKTLSEVPKLAKLPQETPAITNTAKILGAATEAASPVTDVGTAIPAIKSVGKAGTIAPDIGKVKWSPAALASLQKIPAGVKVAGEAAPKAAAYTKDFTKFMAGARQEAALARNPGFYGQVQRAQQLLTRISALSPQAVGHVMPKPPVEKFAVSSAAKSLGLITAKRALGGLKLGKDKALYPRQQLVIFQHLIGKTTGTPTERISQAIGMLRTSEKYLASQGYGFKFYD